ncbi:deoxynucleoside kinase [Heyndrickxia sporothermodurans]|uniref:Deoxynucleoside kinase n=1 Tax=Heyndrickxia sporothermodurans TaxID=46224 RepID=A0AB37HLU2_9BACI|nr:deoxynucleoside kinase [Heyndrickxia sporothermodurans]MBL5768196.1 deoxynucleoside kinase [Heyndrickxia sporothermodurans]MBL5771849.1 deoxynucleoside kinase [Heyndrickxia sporothermodurans]MBL5775889.1 deoxynucleoside kinase [Heyndrickxia sporothermodurans]MBL5778904.1 deoxynucleoside kinase [Heyndrickxia sporothermodurans]MBL5782529.1 deoxynucleoside kinase [Heyndrickxia sporothermodurans]
MELRNKYSIPKNTVITVAGTVGVGKSTMTNTLANTLGFRTSLEKVDTNPYLDKFYQDFKRWSFHLQIYFLAERFKEQKRMFEYGGGFIQDRSIYEDTGIFAQMHYEKGNMSEVDYQTYTSLFEAMIMTPYFPHPDLLIYLEGSIEDILERIQKRGRLMEQNTPVEYWIEMHKRYENWINSFNACPVLRINIKDYDLMNDGTSIEPIIEKISFFLKQTKELQK